MDSGEDAVDVEHANAARMYDYLLGGAHNFAVDRARAEAAIAANPGLVTAARANRDYLRRVVQWALDQGVNQFLDLGSGVPTVGNVHEIALAGDPSARVAYIDVEPIAVAHATEIIAPYPTVSATRVDLRDVDAVLAAPGVAGLVDLGRPVAVLAVAVLHFVPGDVRRVLAGYRDRLAPGSIVALSHGSLEYDDDPDLVARMRAAVEAYRASTTPATMRSHSDIRALLDGLELVEPSLVDVVHWPRHQAGAPNTGFVAAVARRPG